MELPQVFEDLERARKILVAEYGESAGEQFDDLVSQGAIISREEVKRRELEAFDPSI